MKNVKVLCFLSVLLFLAGCTHNDGDIGPWFGEWKIEKMEVDGSVDEQYPGNAFFRFQSSVFSVCKSYPENNSSSVYFGIWEEKEEFLVVNFISNSMPDLYLDNGENRFRILENGRRSKRLEKTLSDGRTVVYYLKSW